MTANQRKVQSTKASMILVLLIWLASSAFTVIGVITASEIINTTSSTTLGEGFSKNLQLILLDIVIILVAIIASTIISSRVGFSLSGNKNVTMRQVSTILLSISGIGIGLVVWAISARPPSPPIYVPLLLVITVQVAIYLLASIFAFVSTDRIRVQVWTYVAFATVLTAPSVILYNFAQ